MADPFVAEIRLFGFNFAPVGWARCDGQVLPISQNTALFSLLGVNFGGNGVSNFALPDLRDSFAMGAGNGPGLTPRSVGERGGQPQVTLTASQIPAHKHALKAGLSPASASPGGNSMAPVAGGALAYRASSTTNVAMAAESLSPAGGGQPHQNRQPALAVNFCIALQGIYPPRS